MEASAYHVLHLFIFFLFVLSLPLASSLAFLLFACNVYTSPLASFSNVELVERALYVRSYVILIILFPLDFNSLHFVFLLFQYFGYLYLVLCSMLARAFDSVSVCI